MLDRRANTFSSYLRAGAVLFASSNEVSALTFRRFVDELPIGPGQRGAKGVGWAEVVDPADSDNYLARMRQNRPLFPAIRPQSDLASEQRGGRMVSRAQVAPITYFSPDTARNRRDLGFDLYSETVRRSAMETAQRTVRPTASGVVDLLPAMAEDRPGFLVFMPVYRTDPQSRDRRRRIAGYLFTTFDAQAFLEAATGPADEDGPAVGLFDGSADGDSLLSSNGVSTEGMTGARATLPIRIANREFRLAVVGSDARTLTPMSMVTLIFGLAIASLLMLVARLLTREAIEDEARLQFFEEQHAIRNKLTRELNHRVKNTLANVLSILALTRRRSTDLDDFATSLDGRIRALSATHDLLTGTDWGTTPIRAIVEAELQHFASSGERTVTIRGPDVELSPNDALSFGLAIHELATNAAKYGALSVPEGSVSVTWSLADDKLAMVEWQEHGGPPVSQLRARGFGTELIEKIVAHELRHRVELDFRPEGVRCLIGVPVRRRSDFEIREKAASTRAA